MFLTRWAAPREYILLMVERMTMSSSLRCLRLPRYHRPTRPPFFYILGRTFVHHHLVWMLMMTSLQQSCCNFVYQHLWIIPILGDDDEVM